MSVCQGISRLEGRDYDVKGEIRATPDQGDQGVRVVERGGNPGQRGRDGKPVAEPVARIIREFVALINKGEAEPLRQFIASRFDLSSGAPLDQCTERMSGLNRDLGAFTILNMSVVDDGSAQVLVKTEREGEAVLILDIEPSPPCKIKRLGLQVGG